MYVSVNTDVIEIIKLGAFMTECGICSNNTNKQFTSIITRQVS